MNESPQRKNYAYFDLPLPESKIEFFLDTIESVRLIEDKA
jgi:hypothetical protein